MVLGYPTYLDLGSDGNRDPVLSLYRDTYWHHISGPNNRREIRCGLISLLDSRRRISFQEKVVAIRNNRGLARLHTTLNKVRH